jgi:transposase
MTSAVEVITSVQRRRRWPQAEKERIVAAAIEPGANACEVSRQAGIHQSQLYRWRRELCGPRQAEPGFVALTVATEPEASSRQALASAGIIEVEFAAGARVRVTGPVDPAVVSAAIEALLRGMRRR